MIAADVRDFQQEVDCVYDGDEYLVRDNGAVLRKYRPGKRKRPLDDRWTFGNPCHSLKSRRQMIWIAEKIQR